MKVDVGVFGLEGTHAGEHVGIGRAGDGLECSFGDFFSVEGGGYGGGVFVGGQVEVCGYLIYVVQRKTRAWGVEVAGGDAGIQDPARELRGDTGSIVDDGEHPVAAAAQRGSYVDVGRAGIAGVL